MDVTSTLRNARGGFAPSDYVTLNFKVRGYYEHTRVVGMRFQYVSTGGPVGPSGPQGPPGPAGPDGAGIEGRLIGGDSVQNVTATNEFFGMFTSGVSPSIEGPPNLRQQMPVSCTVNNVRASFDGFFDTDVIEVQIQNVTDGTFISCLILNDGLGNGIPCLSTGNLPFDAGDVIMVQGMLQGDQSGRMRWTGLCQ